MESGAGADGIYRPPESDLSRPLAGAPGFGSVEHGLRGEFDLKIQDVISEAWALTRGSKGVIVGTMAVWWLISLGANLSGGFVAGTMAGLEPGQEPGPGAVALGMFVPMLANLIGYPIYVGVMLYTVRRAAGDPVASISDVFSTFSHYGPLIGLMVVQSVLTLLGFLLLVLPGIYLSIAYLLAPLLLVEKKMGIWEALETSRRTLNHCWFGMLGLGLVVGLMVVVGGGLTAGIGLIWLVPMAMLCVGVAYRTLFGYERAAA